MNSLYERLGGRQSLHTLVDLFYYKALQDDALKHHFAGADIMALKEHQLEFMTFVFGGRKQAYPLHRLHESHAKLHISHTEFDAICAHLQAAMEDLAVTAELQDEVMGIVGKTRDAIVTA